MGGRALVGVGKIHCTEINSTIMYLADTLSLSYRELQNNLLGSTKKKPYSGDIDIGMENTNKLDIVNFVKHAKTVLGKDNVLHQGKTVNVKIPIINFNPDYNDYLPRTGFVQVDFIFGNLELMKVFYYSPSVNESQFTGTHRNLAIICICANLDRHESEEKDGFDRPIGLYRWKWSPIIGLQRIVRRSKQRKDGQWNKTQNDTPIGPAYTNRDDIINVLFKGAGNSNQLNGLENILAGIDVVYEGAVKEQILRQMCHEFKKHRHLSTGSWTYPKQLTKYMHDV